MCFRFYHPCVHVVIISFPLPGFDVRGVYMLNWDTQEEDDLGKCSTNQDYQHAKEVASKLDIPLDRVHSKKKKNNNNNN